MNLNYSIIKDCILSYFDFTDTHRVILFMSLKSSSIIVGNYYFQAVQLIPTITKQFHSVISAKQEQN